MRLEGNYYELTSMDIGAAGGTFRIALRGDCAVYRGHFPGRAVCPGVYNMQTIKECAERIAGRRLRVGSIDRCRLMAVATPAGCPELTVRLTLVPVAEGYGVTATISDGQRVYMDYRGEMIV